MNSIQYDNLNQEILLQLQQVSFQYPNAKKYALKDINLEIHKGEVIAIVGRNGSGKTTLSKLILGFFHVNTGSITVNQQHMNNIKEDSAYIMQDTAAALDPRSEASLYKQIKEMAIHHTLIMISHRLGSTKLADRIVVLADSRIVEIGSLKNHILHRNPCHWLVSLT